MTARLFRLTELHQRLDERLRYEMRRLTPDQFRLMELKRRKLRVKDLLARAARRPMRFNQLSRG
ncbi:YdcH family protein [Aurantiacibacter marinus]|uniref:DUF465 domain-containing protein n=1 Tax=Aurantiacibacter marinus TaxID=874156 RepID=A0A0H0XRB1_9SPHN|nr:YdcH family protein [Aurantiacibacter marinus]KLI64546.1 hypothetical protein AAV99_02930 [Aurantiacibacter marinus]